MNENLFTFPENASGESGEDAFDLGSFTDLSGDDSDNPFADLLEDRGDSSHRLSQWLLH